MTESEWLEGSDPGPLLAYIEERDDRRGRLPSYRKRRLFCCASLRLYWPLLLHEFSWQAVATAEALADGNVSAEEVAAAADAARRVFRFIRKQWPRSRLRWLIALRAFEILDPAIVAGAFPCFNLPACRNIPAVGPLVREVFGNPFSPRLFDPDWRTDDVRALSAAAYEQRLLPSGDLDHARLAVLSDALEDAGCADADILEHLRSPGPHVRGCWAVDLLTGRS